MSCRVMMVDRPPANKPPREFFAAGEEDYNYITPVYLNEICMIS